jgi:small-conductance mechanosensitive channel
VILLAIAKAISIYAIGRLDEAATRFTLRRIEHLLVALVIAVIVIGVIFVNWYTALISVGIGSVIVGLAVQRPMTKDKIPER